MRLFSVVRKRLNRRAEISRIIRRGRRRFSADARFDLDFAEQGFAPRAADGADDTVLFRRICEAWSKAMERQPSAPEAFQPHPWWDAIRQKSLGPVTRALAAHDLDSLRRMYRNFFRDPLQHRRSRSTPGQNSAQLTHQQNRQRTVPDRRLASYRCV